MIEFRQASKRYGGQVVLDRVDFRLLAGERAGIVGPNGAGKSTIFELIAGESDLDSGTVERASSTSNISSSAGRCSTRREAKPTAPSIRAISMLAKPMKETISPTVAWQYLI